MRRFLRYLRIAYTLVSAIACVLMICLWAYSNLWVDSFGLPVSETTCFEFHSLPNEFGIGFDDRRLGGEAWHTQTPTDDWFQAYWAYYATTYSAEPSFAIRHQMVYMPDWFGVLLAATSLVVALMLGQKWRFSLRTLLIITTLAAIALGELVYAFR
jgi:hypothetical protein